MISGALLMELRGWLMKQCRVLSFQSCCNENHVHQRPILAIMSVSERSVDLAPLLAGDVVPVAEDGAVVMVVVVEAVSPHFCCWWCWRFGTQSRIGRCLVVIVAFVADDDNGVVIAVGGGGDGGGGRGVGAVAAVAAAAL